MKGKVVGFFCFFMWQQKIKVIIQCASLQILQGKSIFLSFSKSLYFKINIVWNKWYLCFRHMLKYSQQCSGAVPGLIMGLFRARESNPDLWHPAFSLLSYLSDSSFIYSLWDFVFRSNSMYKLTTQQSSQIIHWTLIAWTHLWVDYFHMCQTLELLTLRGIGCTF